MDVQTLIEKAGTAVELANRLGVARTTVLDWRRIGSIPGNRVTQISAEFDIPVDLLLTMVQPAKRQREAV
jgi:transcriptional regulator with XRE-family HTH domain